MLYWLMNHVPSYQRTGTKLSSMTSIETTEDWTISIAEDLVEMEKAQRLQWEKLIDHTCAQNNTRPTRTWLKKAKECITAVGEQEVLERLAVWLPKIKSNEPNPIPPRASNFLKGTAWICTQISDQKIYPLLGDLAIAAYHKLPGFGARSKKTGNACVMALGEICDIQAVSQLARLRQKIKYQSVKTLIQETLRQVAARLEIGINELEEISVPDCDVDGNGKMRQKFGEFQAEAPITGRTTALVWVKPDGKIQKCIPASVKRDFAAEVKTFRASAKNARALLAAQKERIERQFLYPREIPYQRWTQYYLDHSLVKVLARGLIWVFVTGDRKQVGIWHQDRLMDIHGKAIEGLDETTRVVLWHPIDYSSDEVLAWRTWLMENEIQQPIKQAFREIYVLTAAEENTNTYSNRFAGHILRQHQFNSLAKIRGWNYSLYGGWDNPAYWATLIMPEHGLTAEFVIEGVHGDHLYADSGICLYVSTDQVRFIQARAVMPLEQIPPRVFSEVFRDVDLFVGVCSVGNDPEWADRGELPQQYRGYWRAYSFGDLSASAETRKQTLELLLPRLKIRDQAWVDGRFLYVKGTHRTYKIHLGSGNILMEPNDQYLCIVANRSQQQGLKNVFLPFEGDQVFSVILSKAFLLAEDDKIKDSTITRQIHRH